MSAAHTFATMSLFRTAEGSLKILPSKVTGVCGVNTGNGVFTMVAIQPNIWVCSYTPSAPFEGATNAQGDYTLEFTWRGHKLDEVWIKTTRYIHAGEELLIQYDIGRANAHWGPMYSQQARKTNTIN